MSLFSLELPLLVTLLLRCPLDVLSSSFTRDFNYLAISYSSLMNYYYFAINNTGLYNKQCCTSSVCDIEMVER